ncbi:Autophagy-related protein 33 [Fusarium oxysporum f. sp. albedinis]|nr:Autophagy-related protein 33 [Fusarium oxysporum f. sp. albedinis]
MNGRIAVRVSLFHIFILTVSIPYESLTGVDPASVGQPSMWSTLDAEAPTSNACFLATMAPLDWRKETPKRLCEDLTFSGITNYL